eukprot:scaffold642_cov232-Pinguiococcus_pyrenoidosus.AAC.14
MILYESALRRWADQGKPHTAAKRRGPAFALLSFLVTLPRPGIVHGDQLAKNGINPRKELQELRLGKRAEGAEELPDHRALYKADAAANWSRIAESSPTSEDALEGVPTLPKFCDSPTPETLINDENDRMREGDAAVLRGIRTDWGLGLGSGLPGVSAIAPCNEATAPHASSRWELRRT